MVVTIVVATVVTIVVATVVTIVVAMAVAMVAAMVVIIVAATVVIMVVVTPNQTLLIQINPLDQKVGKIEVMETLLKILNMKVAEAEEKEEFQMRTMCQIMIISNPSLQA